MHAIEFFFIYSCFTWFLKSVFKHFHMIYKKSMFYVFILQLPKKRTPSHKNPGSAPGQERYLLRIWTSTRWSMFVNDVLLYVFRFGSRIVDLRCDTAIRRNMYIRTEHIPTVLLSPALPRTCCILLLLLQPTQHRRLGLLYQPTTHLMLLGPCCLCPPLPCTQALHLRIILHPKHLHLKVPIKHQRVTLHHHPHQRAILVLHIQRVAASQYLLHLNQKLKSLIKMTSLLTWVSYPRGHGKIVRRRSSSKFLRQTDMIKLHPLMSAVLMSAVVESNPYIPTSAAVENNPHIPMSAVVQNPHIPLSAVVENPQIPLSTEVESNPHIHHMIWHLTMVCIRDWTHTFHLIGPPLCILCLHTGLTESPIQSTWQAFYVYSMPLCWTYWVTLTVHLTCPPICTPWLHTGLTESTIQFTWMAPFMYSMPPHWTYWVTHAVHLTCNPICTPCLYTGLTESPLQITWQAPFMYSMLPYWTWWVTHAVHLTCPLYVLHCYTLDLLTHPYSPPDRPPICIPCLHTGLTDSPIQSTSQAPYMYSMPPHYWITHTLHLTCPLYVLHGTTLDLLNHPYTSPDISPPICTPWFHTGITESPIQFTWHAPYMYSMAPYWTL